MEWRLYWDVSMGFPYNRAVSPLVTAPSMIYIFRDFWGEIDEWIKMIPPNEELKGVIEILLIPILIIGLAGAILTAIRWFIVGWETTINAQEPERQFGRRFPMGEPMGQQRQQKKKRPDSRSR